MILKKTREDSKKSNYNRVVHKPNPNLSKKISKTRKEPTSSAEKRLEYVKSLIGSLPTELNSHMMDWAKKINARVIQIMHIEQRKAYLISSPNYLPKSIRKHEFKLDSKPILEGNEEMAGLCAEAVTVVH